MAWRSHVSLCFSCALRSSLLCFRAVLFYLLFTLFFYYHLCSFSSLSLPFFTVFKFFFCHHALPSCLFLNNAYSFSLYFRLSFRYPILSLSYLSLPLFTLYLYHHSDEVIHNFAGYLSWFCLYLNSGYIRFKCIYVCVPLCVCVCVCVSSSMLVCLSIYVCMCVSNNESVHDCACDIMLISCCVQP